MKRPTPWGPILTIWSALLYGVSPIDILPDVIPILGLVDDIFVVPILLLWGLFALNHHKRQAQTQAAPAYIDVPSTPVIPEDYDKARVA